MQIELAAYGWQGAPWSALYPEDMPPEWRLDYYSNEFSSLVVPAADWGRASIDEASGWLAEAPPGFRFYWEIADAGGASRLLELVSRQAPPHGERLGGWVFQAGLILEPAIFDALASCLPGAAYGERPVSVQQAEQLAAQGITLCWQEGMKLNCRGRRLRVLCIPQPPDLRQLHQAVEEQRAAGVEQLLLVVEPDPKAQSTLRQLQTFLNLVNS